MSWTLGRDVPALLDNSFPLPLTRPFTTGQAAEAGVSRHVLGRLAAQGLVRRLLVGVYVVAQATDTLMLRAQALALLASRDGVVTDWTACWLHTGVLPPGGHLEVPPVSVFRLPGRGRLRNGLSVSGERTLAPRDLTMIEGVTATTPLRTAWDLGRFGSRDWAMAGMDALLRLGDFSKVELVGDVERFRGQRGVVQLRDLAPRADARAESPGESVLRLRWTDLPSLPAPEAQIPVLDSDGREIYRIDLGVPDLRYGLEYDGEEHHTSDEDRGHDERRRAELDLRFGWMVDAVRRGNVFGSSRDVERVLHEGLARARRRLGAYRHTA